jgi:hypothetical protein
MIQIPLVKISQGWINNRFPDITDILVGYAFLAGMYMFQ